VDVEVDSLYVKRIAIEDLVDYVYIVRVDNNSTNTIFGASPTLFHESSR
jgi:hypothetical protein